MWIVAGAVALVGQSLFPDETDFRILMAEPLSRSVVFGAKLAALLLFGGLFVVGSHVGAAAARRADADRRGQDGLGRPGGDGVRGVEPRRQPVRGARRSWPSTACWCCSRRAPSAGVLGRGADLVIGGLVLALPLVARLPAAAGAFEANAWWLALGAAGLVRGPRTLAARRHEPRRARGPGDGGDARAPWSQSPCSPTSGSTAGSIA